MRRWKDIFYTLGLNVLLPRFFACVLLPYVIVIWFHPPADPYLSLGLGLQPGIVDDVLLGSLLLFALGVTANLNVSRYLRLHQTASSPYVYKPWYEWISRSSYFRIQVTDVEAFRKLRRVLRRDHRKAIWLWLWLDDIVFAPALLVILVFAFVFVIVPWLVKYLWKLRKSQTPQPV